MTDVGVARQMAEHQGVKLVLFVGDDLEIDHNGKIVRTQSYMDADNVYIRADHPVYTAEQLIRDKISFGTNAHTNQGEKISNGGFAESAGLQTKKNLYSSEGGKRNGFASEYKGDYNKVADGKQFEQYKRVLKEKAPASFREFQKIKKDSPEAWRILENQYNIVNQYKVDFGEFSVDEILALDDQLITEKRNNFTSGFRRSGNIAGAYVDQKYYLAHSGINSPEDTRYYKGNGNLVTLRTKRIFQYIDVKKVDGSIRTGTFYDTEAKLFEEFAAMYADKPFRSVTMISERGMCESCKGVMMQFAAQFPDVSVRAVSNKSMEGNVWKHRR